jgi:hypothetical protein
MLPDQTLHLFIHCTHKTQLSLVLGRNGPAPLLGKVKLEKIINHETIRRLAG